MRKRSFLAGLFLTATLAGSAAKADFYDGNSKAFEMPFYTGKITPTPQHANYQKDFFDISKVGLLLGKGIAPNDPRLKILKKRLNTLGSATTILSDTTSLPHETIISLGETGISSRKPPMKSEGYLIHSTQKDGRNIIILKGHDKRGLLWAIVSLNQLMTTRKGKPVVERVEIIDFPTYSNRTLFIYPDAGAERVAHYCVAFKFNKFIALTPNFRPYLSSIKPLWPAARRFPRTKESREDFWRTTPPPAWQAELKKLGSTLTPLGIEWYMGIRYLMTGLKGGLDLKIDCKNEKDFKAVLDFAFLLAKNGGGLLISNDDLRFPMSPGDKKNFGTAREADIYLINKLLKSVRQQYPNFKIIFTPPFYWGPAYDFSEKYGESREEYLRAIGDRLDKSVGIFWTGRSTWGGSVKKEEVEWITERIKRKPWFFQNSTNQKHPYNYHYLTDPVLVWTWHYDGFYSDVVFTHPRTFPRSSAFLATQNDYLWNPTAYNAEKSVETAVETLTGPGAWKDLVALNKALTKFDVYSWRFTPYAITHASELRKDLKNLQDIWVKCQSHHPEAVKAWTGFDLLIDKTTGFVNQLKNQKLPPITRNKELLKKKAEEETGFEYAKDIFLSPYDLNGGHPPQDYSFECEARLATWVSGSESGVSELIAKFTLKDNPARKSYDLVICGQDDDSDNKCAIQILLNGNEVFKGANPFVRFGWSRHSFPIKGTFLKSGVNQIVIKNIEKSSQRQGPPFFMVNYVFLKEKPAE